MDLNLECVAQNNDDAPNDLEFYWYQDGREITPSSRITINSTSENATWIASSELVVTGVTDSDSGEYRCTATNRDIVDGITTTSSVTVLCKYWCLCKHWMNSLLRESELEESKIPLFLSQHSCSTSSAFLLWSGEKKCKHRFASCVQSRCSATYHIFRDQEEV